MGLWIADEGAGLRFRAGEETRTLCPQALCLCACGDAIVCAQPGAARVFALDTQEELDAYPLPPGVNRMCALPGALYCLSAEADSVSLLCPRTGRLRLCAQAGCYPRDLCLSPGRKLLAAAGGAAGALYLFDSDNLRLVRRVMLPGVVYSVCFAGEALMALCAVEENDVSAALYRISARGVVSELMRLPGLPGALLSLPGEGLMLGALGALLRLRADGRTAQRFSCCLPARMRLYGGFVLCADALAGKVWRVPLGGARREELYGGDTPVDMLLA